jgi:RNA polymerase sigma-70 factor, ECF subfamily
MRIAFWKNLDSYDGQNPNLETRFHSVARKTVKAFQRTNRSGWERDACLYESPVFVEQARGQWRILEEFMGMLSDLDRQVFALYLDDTSYREMSAMLGVNEPALRKRLSRIKEQFKAKYMGY